MGVVADLDFDFDRDDLGGGCSDCGVEVRNMEVEYSEDLKEKVEMAILRLQTFCPRGGYYLSFSGGKDSQTIYH